MRCAVLVLSLVSSGCAYALHPPLPPDPRFDRPSLVHGMSESDVRQRLGDPDATTQRDGRRVWRYDDAAYARQCRTHLFGIPMSRRHKIQSRALEIRFGPAGVETAAMTVWDELRGTTTLDLVTR
jgi:hypothetical protein